MKQQKARLDKFLTTLAKKLLPAIQRELEKRANPQKKFCQGEEARSNLQNAYLTQGILSKVGVNVLAVD